MLSNPVGPLKVLLEGPPRRRPSSPSRARRGIAVQHRRAGWVVEAIVRVLEDRREPMQAKEVHDAVEALLGQPVHWSSVKAALAANIVGPSSRFVRVAKGRYMLRP